MNAEKIQHKVAEAAETIEVIAKRPMDMARDFFKMEASGGIVLVIASVLALLIANSSLFPYYNYFFNEIDFRIGFSDLEGKGIDINKSILLWINDGLMAIFFFLVGLEIKREVMDGELSRKEQALLPALAAIGGMVVPAAIYWFLNQDDPEAIRGWAIPAATDIAFALGVLALVGSRAPVSLKILLTAVAIIDDLLAILIIAIFYTSQISTDALIVAAIALGALILMNQRGVSKTAPYVLIGFILWVAVLKSGVHATLAGVMTALCIPMVCKHNENHSPVKHMEHSLHPWIAFMVLPIFGFANAGVPFSGMGVSDLLNPVTLGIALGLFVGKQIGVFGLIFLTVKLGFAPKPEGSNWWQLYAISLLCGIGFTMSLFIGGLAFEAVEMQVAVRLGVLLGSVVSAVLAFAILKYGPSDYEKQNPQEAF